MSDVLVPIFGIIFLFGAPVAFLIVSRVLAHQERMAMIRQGYIPPMDHRSMRRAARMGWQPGPTPPPGTSNMGGPIPPMNFYEPAYYAQAQMRKGVSITLIGMALLIGLSFIGVRGDGTFMPGPWLLGGLIPMFVGIAQIINATMNGAQLPFFHRPGPETSSYEGFGSRPSAGPADPQAPSAPSAPYAGWRPGPTPEIEKPAPPPDFR